MQCINKEFCKYSVCGLRTYAAFMCAILKFVNKLNEDNIEKTDRHTAQQQNE